MGMVEDSLRADGVGIVTPDWRARSPMRTRPP
jgi:hypothetical protein